MSRSHTVVECIIYYVTTVLLQELARLKMEIFENEILVREKQVINILVRFCG